MSVLQMQRISICALKKDRKAILEKIQTMGIMEMNQIVDEEDGFEKMDTLEARQSFEKKANLLDTALTILNTYAPEKQSMLSSWKARNWLTRRNSPKWLRPGKVPWKKPAPGRMGQGDR